MLATTLSHQFRHENETRPGAGSLTTTVDVERGMMRGVGLGFWSTRQVAAHFAELRRCVQDVHQRGLAVSAIIDLRGGAAQSQEVAETLRHGLSGIYKTGDRVALVVPSSLVKMQLRRLLHADYHEFFLSFDAAELWAFARTNSR